jgi:Flp pilus assembly protein TadD
MSLINNLLIDLEERRGAPGQQDSLLADLKPAIGPGMRDEGRPVSPGTVVLCCSIVVVAVAGYLDISERTSSMPVESSAAVNPGPETGPQDQPVMESQAEPPLDSGAQAPASLALRLDAQLAVNPVPVGSDPIPAESSQDVIPVTGSSLRKVSIDERNGSTLIQLLLTGTPRYRTYILNNPERAVVEMTGTEFQVADISGLSSSTYIAGVRNSQRDGRLVLVFDLSAPMRIEDATIAPDGGNSQLMMTLAPLLNVAKEMAVEPADDARESSLLAMPSAEPSRMEKIPRDAAAADPAEHAYQKGLEAFQAGRYADSERELRAALEHKSSFIEARYLLASALMQLRRSEEAERIVAEGIRLAPDSSPLRRLAAHIRFERGDVDGALDELERSPPALEADPEYHAFVAALLQHKGKHLDAVRVYQRLLALHPDNSVWWMGLGICLEALARNAEALQAYTYAMTRGSLPPDLRQFVAERISMLGGDRNS